MERTDHGCEKFDVQQSERDVVASNTTSETAHLCESIRQQQRPVVISQIHSNRSKWNFWILMFRGPTLFTCCFLFFIIIPLIPYISYKTIGICFIFIFSILLCCYDILQILFTTTDFNIIQSYIDKIRMVANTTSLDDILQTIYDPLHGIVVPFVSALVAPVSMYTIPFLTQEQRATLFQSAIIPQISSTSNNMNQEQVGNNVTTSCNTDNNEDLRRIFIEPGKWIDLLPKQLKVLLKKSDDNNDNILLKETDAVKGLSSSNDAISVDSTVSSENSYVNNELNDDAGDLLMENKEEAKTSSTQPPLTSPLGTESNKCTNEEDEILKKRTLKDTSTVEKKSTPVVTKIENIGVRSRKVRLTNLPQHEQYNNDKKIHRQRQSPTVPILLPPPHELWQSYVKENMIAYIQSTIRLNKDTIQNIASVGAIGSMIVLIGQIRYSQTARQNIRSLLHLATTITTVTSLTASSSVLLLLLLQTMNQNRTEKDHSPSHQDLIIPITDNNPNDCNRSNTMIDDTSSSSPSSSDIPTNNGQPLAWYDRRSIQRFIHQYLTNGKLTTRSALKGLVAVLLMYYFGNRRNRLRNMTSGC